MVVAGALTDDANPHVLETRQHLCQCDKVCRGVTCAKRSCIDQIRCVHQPFLRVHELSFKRNGPSSDGTQNGNQVIRPFVRFDRLIILIKSSEKRSTWLNSCIKCCCSFTTRIQAYIQTTESSWTTNFVSLHFSDLRLKIRTDVLPDAENM